MARIIFDALGKADFAQHFQIVAGTLLDTLRLDQLVLTSEILDAFRQFNLDRLNSLQYRAARRDVMTGRINGSM